MSKWSKKTFIDHLNQSCESDVAMHCIELVDFSEKTSDEVSWGSGEDFGTMTFRCDSDHGLLPLFRLSSNGKINLQLNFLREYDEDSYPSDSYEPIEDLICTHNQLETFMRTIEGCTYRLKQ